MKVHREKMKFSVNLYLYKYIYIYVCVFFLSSCMVVIRLITMITCWLSDAITYR